MVGNYGNDKEIIELLLNQQGDQITITEEVIKAAVEKSWNSKEVITLLLDRLRDEITIIKDVIKAAAANWMNGEEVIILFLDRREDGITISDEVMSTITETFRTVPIPSLARGRRSNRSQTLLIDRVLRRLENRELGQLSIQRASATQRILLI